MHACDINTYLLEFFELILYQLFISTGETATFFFCVGVATFSTAHARGAWFKRAGLTKPKKMNYYAVNDNMISSNYTLINTGNTRNITVKT